MACRSATSVSISLVPSIVVASVTCLSVSVERVPSSRRRSHAPPSRESFSKILLTYYRPVLAEAGCAVRLHDTTLYTSMFRYDDNLLVNPHIWGQPASANPLLHLKRTEGTGWFDTYAQSFDAVWAAARPWTPDHERTTAHGQD
jgi:hypothetical protein